MGKWKIWRAANKPSSQGTCEVSKHNFHVFEEVLCCFLCTPMFCTSNCPGWSFPRAFPWKAVVQKPGSFQGVFILTSSVGWIKYRVWHKGFDLRGKPERFFCWDLLLRRSVTDQRRCAGSLIWYFLSFPELGWTLCIVKHFFCKCLD